MHLVQHLRREDIKMFKWQGRATVQQLYSGGWDGSSKYGGYGSFSFANGTKHNETTCMQQHQKPCDAVIKTPASTFVVINAELSNRTLDKCFP